MRGKCFIEYIPAEYAWAPVDAPEYMYIDCLWVSGQFKGHGYSTELLDECIRDSREKGKKGLAVISSKKKKGFLSDPKYLGYKGFRLADSADPYFELWYLPFSDGAAKPRFRSCVNEVHAMPKGFYVTYTSQCPFTAKYVPLLKAAAQARDVSFTDVHFGGREEARNARCRLPHLRCITTESSSRTRFSPLANLKKSWMKSWAEGVMICE